MTLKLLLGSTVASLVLTSSAYAETTPNAWTDLNLRTGPSTTYDIVGVIPRARSVIVDGCLDTSNSCRVTHGDVHGWASGDYLMAMVGAPIYSNRERLKVKSITYEKDADTAFGGAVVAPTEMVTTYVRSNPLDSVFLDGEVVVGAGIPEAVTLSAVPDSEYDYAYVNGVPILVEREQRRGVYIVR